MTEWRDIARITGKHGSKGRLVVSHSANLPFLCEEGIELAIVPPRLDAPRRVHLRSVQETGSRFAQISFEEVDSIRVAEALVGCHLLVDARALPDDVGIVPDDLIGLEVRDTRAGRIGCVSEVIDNGCQQLIVVKTEDAAGTVRETMIPLVEDIVESIDAHEIAVSCPKGLLELGLPCA